MAVLLETPPNDPGTALQPTSVGGYLIDRLAELGVRHIFGIPGDYILAFFKMLEIGPIETVVTTNELCAGYAADAYARVNGIGAAVVTYAVGGFSIANALASAYAEKSPVVFISGSPGTKEIKRNRLLHHMVGAPGTQREMLEKLTVASCVLDDPLTAFREIDRVLNACLRFKRPVYIELPRDRVGQAPIHPHTPYHEAPISDPNELAEAVTEAVAMLRAATNPVLIAGIDLHRWKLQEQVLRLAERHGIPIAATLLSKSVVREKHPQYIGIYQAAMGRPAVTKFVEESDCVVMLGAMITDVDTGIFTHNLDDQRVIFATSEQVRIRYHHYEDVLLEDFVSALSHAELPKWNRTTMPDKNPVHSPWQADPAAPVTVRRLFQKVNSLLPRGLAVVADPGDALFGAADLEVPGSSEFLSSAFYATLGWAVPAAIGAQIARRDLRPIVLVGDGAFQMTGTELGTTARAGLNPIVVVLNNKGYLTERFIIDGKFNDVPNWNYHKLPEFLGLGCGFEVRNEGELDEALEAAIANTTSFSLVNVHLDPWDCSPALRRLGEGLARRM